MITDEIIESFVNCKYKAYLKINKGSGKKTEFELMQDVIVENCKKRFRTMHIVQEDFAFENNKILQQLSITVEPKIKTDKFDITFDAVEILPHTSQSNSYIPILISPNETVSKSDKILLCIKYLILLRTYEIPCKYGKIIHGSDLKTIKFALENYQADALRTLKDLQSLAEHNDEPILYRKDHCKICEFQERCMKKLEETDGLGRLSRMDEKEIEKYKDKGIFTVNQLSYTFKPRKRSKRLLPKGQPYSDSLKALAIREQKVYVYDEVKLQDASTKVFVDMEGNYNGSLVYLIGLVVSNKHGDKKYSLWANSEEEEESIFKQFAEILGGLEDVHIFYFGKYESTVFKRILNLNLKSKTRELISNHSTNVISILYKCIYFPTYSNGLKDIGKYLGCTWSSQDASAINTVVWRARWEESQDSTLKANLIVYNEEDCIALKKLTEFLGFVMKAVDSGTNPVGNVNFVKDMKPDEEWRRFKNMECASEDIKIITKSAYFEYQRNKIYWRSDKNFKKIIKREKKQERLNIRVNKTVYIRANKCPYCKGANITARKKNEYQTTVFDLKFTKYGMRRWIVKYITYPHRCRPCQKNFIPEQYKQVLYYSRRYNIRKKYINRNQRGYGHGLLSYVLGQILTARCSMENLSSNLIHYFKIPAEKHRMHDLKIMAGKYYKTTYHLILKKLVNGNLIHADESKLKLKFNHGYLWVFTNLEEVYYLYQPNREANFLREFLEGFNGVLVSDFYTGYDSVACHKQRCLVHLIRDMNDILLKNLHDQGVKEIVTLFGSLLRDIIRTTDKFGLNKRFLRKHKKIVEEFFATLRETAYTSETAESIQKRLLKHQNELFAFLDYDNIPWNNNNAEYSIKIFKDYLNHIKGVSSGEGIEAYTIFLSIYQTCRYKGINFLDFILSREKDIDKFVQKGTL